MIAGEALAMSSLVWKVVVEIIVTVMRKRPVQRTQPSTAKSLGLPKISRFSGQQNRKITKKKTATTIGIAGA